MRLCLGLAVVLLLTGCATKHGSGMGYGEAPGGRICRAFYPADFYLSQSGVSADGDLLTYTQPSVDCGSSPTWVGHPPGKSKRRP